MKIERVKIQKFKTIQNIAIDDLSGINIFFGLNDVGKSNIFEALALGYWLVAQRYIMPSSIGPGSELTYAIDPEKIEKEIHVRFPFQPLDDHKSTTRIEMSFRINEAGASHTGYLDSWVELTGSNYRVGHSWRNVKHSSGKKHYLPEGSSSRLHIIEANRRLGIERRSERDGPNITTHQNLKKALFYAYLSSDMQQKRRLEAIRKTLAEPPFELGLLDVALIPETDAIDIGFVRPSGRLSIENLGSGSQQLLLILGQVFLNNFPIVILEEPEMNLSPQYQQSLLIALRRLMADPAISLSQLFISTHSPYLEFAENFYDVTLDEHGHTQIVRATPQDHTRHFATVPLGPETGARLNSLNQIQLYQGVLDDLDLQRGDMVFFVKDEAGRWEIRPEGEVLDKMKAAWSDNGGGE